MHLARVIGRVVATRRITGLAGERLLIVQPYDETGDVGETLVACDMADSGLGDRVHVCDGREASMALAEPFVPVDATIVGHVEQFDHEPAAARGATGRKRKGR
ncbi:MAG: EutN/CcmL family microcompartment protein [Planctomycetota bacterium]|jgi:ethanolamine utilization protein EutN